MDAIRISCLFQSTLSVRRATRRVAVIDVGQCISIHALRKESDENGARAANTGELFQSTLSVRRATHFHTVEHVTKGISIHALRKESDL